MGKSWVAPFQARARKNIAKGRCVSHAILANLECVGGQDWAIKLNAWSAVSKSNQNMPEKQAKTYSKEVPNMWTMWKRGEPTSHSGNISKRSMAE